MTAPERPVAIVIGAGGGLAQALIARLLDADPEREVIAVSRSQSPPAGGEQLSRLHWLQSDYSDASIERVGQQLREHGDRLDRVFLCNGILHSGRVRPEKRLEDLSREALLEVYTTNAITPLLWLRQLKPALPKDHRCIITAFSARVGSIDDNQKGGWYAYRASKAGLNMLLRNAAIELTRLNRNLRFVAFHPGTADTALSKPFQKSVPEGKLFSPDFVAQSLLGILEQLPDDTALQFLDWEGKPVAW